MSSLITSEGTVSRSHLGKAQHAVVNEDAYRQRRCVPTCVATLARSVHGTVISYQNAVGPKPGDHGRVLHVRIFLRGSFSSMPVII